MSLLLKASSSHTVDVQILCWASQVSAQQQWNCWVALGVDRSATLCPLGACQLAVLVQRRGCLELSHVSMQEPIG